MVDTFSSAEICPALKLALIAFARSAFTSGGTSLRTLFGTLSGPGAFPVASSLIIWLTSASETSGLGYIES